MASASTLGQNVGKTATLHTNELKVSVRIIDAKSAYGALRFLVEPVAGSGQVWVSADRVTGFQNRTFSILEPK